MRQHESWFEQHGVDVKVVTFDSDYLALAYINSTNLQWPLLLDSEQELYRAYAMQRGNWWTLYGPASILVYLKLILRGRLPGRPGRDWSQLGGDVMIDPNGIVRLHHVSASPHDRPPIETIVKMIEVS